MKKIEIKNIILKTCLMAMFLIVISVPLTILAQNELDYTLLAPLPCVGGDCQTEATKTTLEKYLPGLFNLLIGLSAVAAVVMIVFGGFQYMTTDAIQGKERGRERIKNAVFGLVLVISAWLILFTINPNLLTLNLNIESAITEAPAATGGDGQTPSGSVVWGQWKGSPRCNPPANGFCSATNLQSFGDQAENASRVCNCESGGVATVDGTTKTSSGYPRGLFQITEGTAKDFGCDYEKLKDPKLSISCATKIYNTEKSWRRWECATGCGIK